MNSIQHHILRVLSSVCMGIIAFCIALPLLLIMGASLLLPFFTVDGAAFFPPEFVVLLLISFLVAIIVAVLAGKKYYRHLETDTSY